MNGSIKSKKPTYRDLQQEIAQIAIFVQKLSTVILQLDQEVVELRNELEENKTIKTKAEREAVSSTEPEAAIVEDYFPTKGDSNE